MEERNWSICFLCQDFIESHDGLSFPAKTVGMTDEKLKKCFLGQINLLAKFHSNNLMPDGINCQDVIECSVNTAVETMMSHKKEV